jgi:hypothetical protein
MDGAKETERMTSASWQNEKSVQSIVDRPFDAVLTLGENCRIAEAMRDLDLRRESLPLDWCNGCPHSAYLAIADEFAKHFEPSRLRVEEPRVYLNEDYAVQFTHESDDLEAEAEKYRRRSRRFVETLRSTDRRVLLLGQVLDRRGAMDPWNPPATRHARYCLERFGPGRCSAAHFDAVHQLVRERYPLLDFEMIVINYDPAKRPRGENVVYRTLPFVSLGASASPDYSALKRFLRRLPLSRHGR